MGGLLAFVVYIYVVNTLRLVTKCKESNPSDLFCSAPRRRGPSALRLTPGPA